MVAAWPPAEAESPIALAIAVTYFAYEALMLHEPSPLGLKVAATRGLKAASSTTLLPVASLPSFLS